MVGLISDTHIPTRANAIPPRVFEVFVGSNLIMHAGDLTQLRVLSDLERLAPVVAVYGNMDEPDVRERLPKMESVEVYNWKIGVVHNPGALWGTRRMKRVAKQNNLDVLVFGHTHRPTFRREEGILFINPGSPTNPLPPLLTKPTIALLRVTKERIEPEIVKI
ncbi:MAG: metallophosphoesterase family protein [Candidatus Bathyarchaeia archaeon]